MKIRYNEGSLWFRRLQRDCKKMSRHIRFKKIANGFFRIYYKQAYLHEVYKEMPQHGYDFDYLDPRFELKKYVEEKEDRGEITRLVKNYVEGYWDSIDRIRTRFYMYRNNPEFNKTAIGGYAKMNIK